MPANEQNLAAELAAAIAAARTAGAIVRDYYDRAAASTYEKTDGSPVTDADLAADAAIREVLARQFPDDPILSEEGADDITRFSSRRCWIVDPVDGTEQFIRRTGEFDVLVALVIDGRPVVAAGLQPPTGVLITATLGGGAWRTLGAGQPERITFENAPELLRIATSKWFGAPANQQIIQQIAEITGAAPPQQTALGLSPRIFTSSREFDVLIGIRPGTDQSMASEWDFAVADLVVHEAGGIMTDLAGARFQYNKPTPRNVGGLILAADAKSHAAVLRAVHARASSTQMRNDHAS